MLQTLSKLYLGWEPQFDLAAGVRGLRGRPEWLVNWNPAQFAVIGRRVE